MAGCSGSSSSDGVAATVNGEEISEALITQYVADYRTYADLEDDDDWAAWLVEYDYTAEDIREIGIEYYIELTLIAQAAEENGVSVTDEEVDEAVQEAREYYGLEDDDDWAEALELNGYTEESYWEEMYYSVLSDALQATVITEVEVDDDEILEYANLYAEYYLDGYQDIDVIVCSDEETANELLSQINSGELTFDEAKEQNDGITDYDGITSMATYDSVISETIAEMEDGSISGVVVSTDTEGEYYIIRVNETIEVPETDDDSDPWASADELPTSVYEAIYDMVYENNLYIAYIEYLDTLWDEADIVINDMPDGLPYDVDTSSVSSDDEEEATTEEDDTTDESSEEEDATEE